MLTQNNKCNFILKLSAILKDHPEAISWGKSGKYFQIKDEHSLKTQVFPQYFRHGNLSSFIRQLSSYNFKKIRLGSQHGYFHPIFFLGNQDNFHKISKRTTIKSQRLSLIGIKNEPGVKDTSVMHLMRKLVSFEFFSQRKTQNIKNLVQTLKDELQGNKKNSIKQKIKKVQKSIHQIENFQIKIQNCFESYLKNVDIDNNQKQLREELRVQEELKNKNQTTGVKEFFEQSQQSFSLIPNFNQISRFQPKIYESNQNSQFQSRIDFSN